MSYRFKHLEEKAKNLHQKLMQNQQIDRIFVVMPFQKFGTFCSLIYKDCIDEKANRIVIFAEDNYYKVILYNHKSQILYTQKVCEEYNIISMIVFLYQSQPSIGFSF
jgi:hypothetical protein